jgi:hypothetical protein
LKIIESRKQRLWFIGGGVPADRPTFVALGNSFMTSILSDSNAFVSASNGYSIQMPHVYKIVLTWVSSMF